jgi:hypothetical protein
VELSEEFRIGELGNKDEGESSSSNNPNFLIDPDGVVCCSCESESSPNTKEAIKFFTVVNRNGKIPDCKSKFRSREGCFRIE